MNDKWKYTINSRKEYLTNRNQEVSRLRDSISPSNHDQIQEYINTIVKSYDESTVVNKIAVYKKEEEIESRGFRSIGLYQSIKKEELFAKDYYWLPFFSDVGRAISRAERKYLQNRIGKYVRGVGDTISYSKPDFDILKQYVTKLLDKGYKPDIMLAPIQLYSIFLQSHLSEFSKSNWRTEQIRLEGCDIKIVWSHKYASLRSFIIFNSSNGIWHVVHDNESERGITVAIGESKENPDRMLYIAETMAYYEILNKEAFIRINLSS